MLAIHPSGVRHGVTLEHRPQIAAAVADNHDRSRVRGELARTDSFRDCRLVTLNRRGRDEVESVRRARAPNAFQRCVHQRSGFSPGKISPRVILSAANDLARSSSADPFIFANSAEASPFAIHPWLLAPERKGAQKSFAP